MVFSQQFSAIISSFSDYFFDFASFGRIKKAYIAARMMRIQKYMELAFFNPK